MASPARGALAALVAGAALLAVPAPVGAATAPTAWGGADGPPVSGPTRAAAWTARIVYPTVARAAPRADARRVARVDTAAAWNGGPVTLLVLAVHREEDRRLWLKVRLPERPNDRAGWIDADYARLHRTPWRIEIDRDARRAFALRDGRRVRSWRIVVGRPGAPTPRGLFAVYETVRQPSGSVLGPYALQLTSHSNTIKNFGGGPGRVAIHGRSGSLLADPLGSARSHGCIRMSNGTLRWLTARARPGTPVQIR